MSYSGALAIDVAADWVPIRVAVGGWEEQRTPADETDGPGVGRNRYSRPGVRVINRVIAFRSAEIDRLDAYTLAERLAARPFTVSGWLSGGTVTGCAPAIRVVESDVHLYASVECELMLDPAPSSES